MVTEDLSVAQRVGCGMCSGWVMAGEVKEHRVMVVKV